MHFEISLTGIQNRGHWPWPSRSFGHYVSGFQETASNVTVVYWTRPAARRCVTSHCTFVLHMVIIERSITYIMTNNLHKQHVHVARVLKTEKCLKYVVHFDSKRNKYIYIIPAYGCVALAKTINIGRFTDFVVAHAIQKPYAIEPLIKYVPNPKNPKHFYPPGLAVFFSQSIEARFQSRMKVNISIA